MTLFRCASTCHKIINFPKTQTKNSKENATSCLPNKLVIKINFEGIFQKKKWKLNATQQIWAQHATALKKNEKTTKLQKIKIWQVQCHATVAREIKSKWASEFIKENRRYRRHYCKQLLLAHSICNCKPHQQPANSDWN